MIPRPDEKVVEASKEKDENFRRNLKRGVKTAATIGAAVFSPALTSRIMPFLSQYIPTDLAVKGISKVSPKIGEFLKKGQSMGLDMQEGLDFVKKKMTPQETAKESRNIIEQYSPELHQFIDQEVKKGRPAIEAGAIAQNDKRFSDVIKKLSKDHKTPWSNILESVYGGQQQAQPQSQMSQPQQQQSGQGQQNLAAILEKINQRIGQ